MSDVDFKIGANSNEANAALDKLADKAMTTGQRIQSSMREASYKMASEFKGSFEKINGEFGKVIDQAKKLQGVMLAVGAVLAGGKVFKAAVDETVTMTKEAKALAQSLGITVTEANNLNIALDDIHQSSDTLLAGNAKLTKQLTTDEDAFKKLGVATRDQNGHFRNSLDIMLDVNKKLAEFKEGTDRNVEANKIYGKSYADMLPIIKKLSKEGLEEARQKAESLGLTIGKEGVASVDAYNNAMNDVGDVMSAFKKVIGDALMPVLSQLGVWFSSAGPGMVLMFKGALGGIITVIQVLIFTVKMLATVFFMTFKAIIDIVSDTGEVITKIFSGDFEGALEAAKSGTKNFVQNFKDGFNEIRSDAEETNAKIAALFSGQTAIDKPSIGATGTSEGGTKTPKAKDPSRAGEWDTKLAEIRDAYEKQKLEQGSFEEFGKARERDYWKNILDTVKMSTEERRQVSSKYYALERELRKTAYENEVAEMRSNLNAYREGSVERIQIAGEIAQKAGQKYGLESKEYKAAMDDMQQMAKARAKQQEQLDSIELERTRTHQLNMLQLEQVRIEESAAMGDLTESQKLTALAKLKEEEFQIELKAATDRAALLTDDVVAYQEAMDKIIAIKQKHEVDKAKVTAEIKVADKKEFDDMFDPMAKSFEKSVNGIIAGTTTVSKAMKNMAQSAALEYANMGVKIVADWAAKQAMKLLISTTTAAQETAVAATAAVTQAGAQKALGISGVMSNAAIAATAAMASVAAIPFYGWAMAPGVGASTYALGMGYLASAEGGYDIPAGMNPMTQLHEKEMVLPAQHADVIRSMADGGVAGGTHHHHYNIKAMDAGSFVSFLKSNPNALAKGIGNAKRNFSKG